MTSSTSVSSNVWHRLETYVLINGSSGHITVWLDGVLVSDLNRNDNFGTSAIGRLHVGDFQGSDVFDLALDEVKVGTGFIP